MAEGKNGVAPGGTSTTAAADPLHGPRAANGAPPLPKGAEPDDHIFVDDVKKSFGSTQVLRGITMHLKRQQTAVIIGGSGAGKTTLLRMLHRAREADDGPHLGRRRGHRPPRRVPDEPVRQKFGMVFQYAALLDSLTIFENVAFPLREHRKHLSSKEMRDKVTSMLEQLGVTGKEDRMPSELSGGQRKRVGLARALMLDPKIIIYDEPTSGLDPLTSRMVDDLIEFTRSHFGVTSVVISHDMASTFRIAHQAFLVVEGQVIASGKPDEIANGDVEEARKFILASGVDTAVLSRVGKLEDDERRS